MELGMRLWRRGGDATQWIRFRWRERGDSCRSPTASQGTTTFRGYHLLPLKLLTVLSCRSKVGVMGTVTSAPRESVFEEDAVAHKGGVVHQSMVPRRPRKRLVQTNSWSAQAKST